MARGFGRAVGHGWGTYELVFFDPIVLVSFVLLFVRVVLER
jgi:hypothetical protein